MVLGYRWIPMNHSVLLGHTTEEQMHFISMVEDPAVGDAMLSAAMLRLDINGVRFAVGHRIANYPTHALVATEMVRAVFGAWRPHRWRREVPARYQDLLYVTDKRILLVTSASPTGAVRSVAGRTALEQMNIGLAGIASRIAGPYFAAWTAEAWRADLEVGPVGTEEPMSRISKLCYALGLVFVTAPRYRLTTAAHTLIHLARVLWARALYSNVATGMIVGGLLTWAAVVLRASSGSAAAASFLSTAVPAAAWGVRWLRARSSPPLCKDQRRNR